LNVVVKKVFRKSERLHELCSGNRNRCTLQRRKKFELMFNGKVLMVESIGDGGIAHYAYCLINKLSEKGTGVFLFTAKRYELDGLPIRFNLCKKMFRLAASLIKRVPSLDKETGFAPIIRRAVKAIEYPLNTLEAVWFARKKNIGIVHLQSVNLIELVMVIAFRMDRRRVIYTIHNVMPRHQRLRFYHRVLYRVLYSLCDELIIHSAKGSEQIVKLYRVDKRKVHVIPHGDYKLFVPQEKVCREKAKEGLGIERECKTILFFGAIRENKGLDDVLMALPIIKEHLRNVKLLIVGEPWESFEKYRRIIRENRLGENVFEKLNYVPNEEIPAYFFAADMVVLPYKEVTQSGILQVAYAFQKPVVATDLCGFMETIEDGANGYLVPAGDIKALAEKCCLVLADETVMERMGKYSGFLCDKSFSWDSIAERTILEVYASC
jgi:glycosyltransferase involved in cell wall biosynthesis